MPVLLFVALFTLLLPVVLLAQCCKKEKTTAGVKGATNSKVKGSNAKSKSKDGVKKPSIPAESKKEKDVKAVPSTPTSTATGPPASLATAFSQKEKPKSKPNVKQCANTVTAAGVQTKAGAVTALPKGQPVKMNDATAVGLEKKTMIIKAESEKAKEKQPNTTSVVPNSMDDGTTQTFIITPDDMKSVAALTANPGSIEDISKIGPSSSFYDQLDKTTKTTDSLYENVDLPKTKSKIESEIAKDDEDDDDTEKSIMKSKLADEQKQKLANEQKQKKADEQKKKMAAPDEYQTLANLSTEKVFEKRG